MIKEQAESESKHRNQINTGQTGIDRKMPLTMAMIMLAGARIHIRRIIWYAF